MQAAKPPEMLHIAKKITGIFNGYPPEKFQL